MLCDNGIWKKTDIYSGETYDLDKTYLNIIKPAVEESGLDCVRGDEIQDSGLIDKNMYALLLQAELVIADITTYNPNAIYELGVRHAARPFSTIIIKETHDSIPFDLNHNKIFHYEHMGDDIGATEAQRCVKDLKLLIESVVNNEETDSPFFQYISSIKPYVLPREEFNYIIQELADKEKHIFAIVEKAKNEMASSNFIEAKKFWLKALNKVENEPYFIQQYALSTYKSKEPSERTALQDALNIIFKLEPDSTNDPETLGLTGAIYKRLWLLDKDVEYLNRAIDYYRKGFQINNDYYTGENYALCLDFKALSESNDDEKIYYKVEAKKTREKIIFLIEEMLEQDNFEQRNDLKWIYATYSICLLALGKEREEYEKLFYSKLEADWERETYESSKKHIIKLNK
ncbi:TRAFs-binding domain-containing protein [endosymbiont of Tevnia jerichonana]|uniref:Tetratricopeptide TPR_2 repeat protein n=1 Tax=endosymbiont of Tevnia jerichonana (vent Tica) TaxID=1049564 RepID=G2FJZ1_9GAMM|nr:TRAFs-binding domain-containing protein [endosymbiont of Tevnia jerichonana]EGW52884.1 tetratricopeptide TPR_2 repeat protein [endosymbiont of Tevnia jerichonana (vent Tica)]